MSDSERREAENGRNCPSGCSRARPATARAGTRLLATPTTRKYAFDLDHLVVGSTSDEQAIGSLPSSTVTGRVDLGRAHPRPRSAP